ncbi:alpha-galactosidase [Alkalispirochaeta americana]|uniref:Alpha-galactosidase n=1 Tax=Alkalispirochaeta americana TaxID=159291 RepID=A0A1N6TV47_9SPIO|nr:alpha-galactosidase [Alkalispirochaeta americana]SIQ57127.1 alpha-galactosidase [Alkalispirochaeta americana]
MMMSAGSGDLITCREGDGDRRGPIFSLRCGRPVQGGRQIRYELEVVDGTWVSSRHWGPFEAGDRPLPGRADYMTTLPWRSGQGIFSPDLLPREYPSWGTGELRAPAWMVRRHDGTRAGSLEYRGYGIHREPREVDALRPRGLPWVKHRNMEVLRVDCADPAGGVEVSLFYGVVGDIPILLRWVRVTNSGSTPVELEQVASASVDLPAEPLEMITLNGAWARERSFHRRPLGPGVQLVESRGGSSGHHHAPFVAVAEPGCCEDHGTLWGLSLVYSGNHRHQVEVDQYGQVRLQAGINPLGFAWHLKPGESFDAPLCVLGCSDQGFNGLSEALHRFVREALLPVPWRDRDRPIVANTWEAHYFDVNGEKVADLAREAARVGAEVLVLDDGWFRGRHDDTSSLGDWTPDGEKFPRGLRPVAEAVHLQGLRFGLWMEPEMVSPRSDLFRDHPEWVLGIAGRDPTLARNQLVLDLANPEVVEYLTGVIRQVLASAPIDYLKWDMNRPMSEAASPSLPADAQGEVMHRYILGLYRILEAITEEFPDLLIEGCAGGGGRFDYGMLAWTPQFWTSDQTDAIQRLEIQRGTSMLFPPETMGAHVSAVPNHQVGRVTPASLRALTALAFNYGYELDLARETEADRLVYRRFSELYRRNRGFFRRARFVRLKQGGNDWAWAAIAPDRQRALVFYVQVLAGANPGTGRLLVPGLEEYTDYRVSLLTNERCQAAPVTLSGAALQGRGLDLPPARGDYEGTLWELIARDGENNKERERGEPRDD